MRLQHLPVIILLVIIGVTTFWNLFQKNIDTTLFNELRGISHDLHIKDLCSPSPFAGTKDGTTNVASRKMTSLIYSIPTKILYGTGIPLHLIHRGLDFIFFMATLVFLYLIAEHLALSIPIRLLLLTYYGLSEQVLISLFTSQLSTVSILWFVIVVFLYIKLLSSLSKKPNHFPLWLGLFVLTLFSGYETFIVARPLALAILLYLGCQFLFFERRIKPLYSIAMFLLFIACSWTLLQLAHEDLRFDLTAFQGVGESIIKQNSSSFMDDSMEHVRKRISELPLLLNLPVRSHIGAWWPTNKTTGWLHVWVGLLALIIFHTVLKLQYPKLQRKYPLRSWLLLFLAFCGFIALLIPLASTTGIRGHRLFALYISSSIALAVLLDRTLVYWDKYSIRLLNTIIIGTSILLLWNQMVVVTKFSPLDYDTKAPALSQHLFAISDHLNKDKIIHDSTNQPPHTTLICNQGNKLADQGEVTEKVTWTYALYASGFGCRMQINEFNIRKCECDNIIKQENSIASLLCIDRAADNTISVHRINL